MKRHEALEPLSRHHFNGLFQARQLVRAGLDESDLTPREIARGFMGWWQAGTQDHFRDEEEVLFPHFARFGDPDIPVMHRILLEHVLIRRAVLDVGEQVSTGGPIDAGALRELGELLNGHIRTEERELFPLIEEAVPDGVLDGLKPFFHDVVQASDVDQTGLADQVDGPAPCEMHH